MKHDAKGAHIVISMKSSSIELSVVIGGELPIVVFTKKQTLLFQKALSPEEFIRESFENLEKLLESQRDKLVELLPPNPDCHVVFYSPWFLPEIRQIEEKTKKVNLKDLIRTRVQDPKEKSYEQIENKITNIMVNGYHLDEIKDVNTDDIEINIFRSYLSKEAAQNTKKIIKKSLISINRFEFSSSAMQTYELIKSLYVKENNCCFINIGGEVTEFGIIEDDVLVKFSTFPMGTHAFSRELSTFANGKEETNTIDFIGDPNVDHSLDKKVKDRISKTSAEWVERVKEIIEEFPGEIPKKTFILNNSDSVEFFKKVLESSDLKDELFFVNIKNSIFDKKIAFKEKRDAGVEYLVSGYYSQIVS